ncbi:MULTISPECIES: SDR family oxidoreductase [unclassified Variovorax]|mgnify:FL=1|uniref:SDR family oxidoreductase n=1 Tax=unclassified Variovorax TaxID=663243 RepID=UPI000F7E0A3E|nr:MULTISPECIES: SDR family oxidoreductase [unclassified Variovorax]RSZ33185.1 SDR family oxidoreductase [Variovorax sp. 553]RSZ33556.1 SDR family oxidoreductase [Variovorax sp. 679]
MKTALITGCSSGYGKATAEHFLKQGWNVVATMRKPDPALLGEPSERLRVVRLDVTDADSIAQAIGQSVAAFGHLDVLVNNAGIGLFSAFESTPMDTIREVFETNTFGVMAMTQAMVPLMRERGEGAIVNVTSSVCFAGMPLVAPYAASKFAIEGFTEALFFELESVGVRVRLVEPGYGPGTAFTANGMERMNGLISPPYQAYAGQLMAQFANAGAVTTPDQVAAAVFAAATEESETLRFPAGPDSAHLANARWNSTDEQFLAGMRSMLRMKR